jgi:hypothetical protein
MMTRACGERPNRRGFRRERVSSENPFRRTNWKPFDVGFTRASADVFRRIRRRGYSRIQKNPTGQGRSSLCAFCRWIYLIWMRLHQRWPHLLSPAKSRPDRVIRRSSIPILLHYIIWPAQSMVCRQYGMMSTCQVGINDDLKKELSARRLILIIRNFEAQWRPIGMFDFRPNLKRHADRTAVIPAHQTPIGSRCC